MKIVLLAICGAAISCPKIAQAYCTKPRFDDEPPAAPDAYEKPEPPFCLESLNRECKEWELKKYKDETDRYIRSLKSYARKAQDFADATSKYADKAERYAKCKIRDTENQME